MKILDICQRLGLSTHASEVYVSLLSLGQSTVTQIARMAKIERLPVYRVLPELHELGLIAKITKGKHIEYTAMPPERLRELHTRLGGELEQALPTLKTQHEKSKRTSTVKHLVGREGIVAVYDDILETLPVGGTFYRYSSGKTERRKNLYVPKDYAKRRDAKRLERFVITNKATAARKKPTLERALKSVPAGTDLFAHDITELIYGNKVAFVDYGKEAAIIIENKEVAEFQTRLFKLLYQRL